jgi:hypothetical protein
MLPSLIMVFDMNQHPKDVLKAQLERIPYLRATGPNPFDYWLWADYVASIVTVIYGADSVEALRFQEAISEPGRTSDQRGINDNMTLGLHGEWGIWARLDRAARVLQALTGSALPASPS